MVGHSARIARRRFDVVLDTLAVAGVVALLVFPVAAVASAPETTTVADTVGTLAPLGPHPDHGRPRRDLPVFTDGGAVAQALAGGGAATGPGLGALVAGQLRAVFSARGDGGLGAILAGCTPQHCSPFRLEAATEAGATLYPFRFAAIDRSLDAALGTDPLTPVQAAAVTDLAGLLVLAAADFLSDYSNAAPVAFALYERARGTRAVACDAHLGLAVLTAGTTGSAAYGSTVAEYRGADRDCAGRDDPTPLWMLGQYQSTAGSTTDAQATFRELERRWPGSVLGWSGEADTLLRDASRRVATAPFTARADFRRARLLYARARSLGRGRRSGTTYLEDRDPGLAAGEAQAAAGLGDFAAAQRADRDAIALAGDDPEPFRALLVTDLERAARAATSDAQRSRLFSAAAALPTAPATGSETTSAPSPGHGLFPANQGFGGFTLGHPEDGGPISVGAGRLRAAGFTLATIGTTTGVTIPATGAVEDISFIPEFRHADEFRGSRPCLDLLFAHRATDAAHAGDGCAGFDQVIEYERKQPATDPGAGTLDADQNAWRYAGDLDAAMKAATRLTDLEPANSLGPDQAGEIAFLRKDYRTAATMFAEAARRARRGIPTTDTSCAPFRDQLTTEAVAQEQLKEGTALELDGRLHEAGAILRAADAAASPLAAASHPANVDDCGVATDAAFDSYNARVQLGDTALRRHSKEMPAAESTRTFREAEESYAKARERVPTLFQTFHPEALANNEAIVLAELGKPDDALRSIRSAVRIDPANPVFLENQGYVEERLGRTADAVKAYRAALRADPTAYQAANDLGVLLAERGHLHLAAGAFRQAIAARHQYAAPEFTPSGTGGRVRTNDPLHPTERTDAEYPTGEFNLGIVLGRMGPGHLLESQGAFAAAMRADPELRERGHQLIRDDETVFTTLDLSKPLPPKWHLAAEEHRTPIMVGGVVIAVVLVSLFRTVAEEEVKDKAKEEVLELESHHLARTRRLGERIPGAVAVAAVVAVFAYPLSRSSGTTRNDYLVIGLGVAITAFAFMRLRSALARRAGIATRHHAYIPGLLVGGAAAFLTLGYAPMPATRDHASIPGYARWGATALLGALTLTLLATGHFSGVPFATSLGKAGLVMTASTLVPVKPYDGAYLDNRRLALLVALALTGLTVIVELGYL